MDQQHILNQSKTTMNLIFDIVNVEADGNTASTVTIVDFLTENDSTQDTKEELQADNFFKEMIKGKQFEIVFARTGKIIKFSGIEKIKNEMSKQITNSKVKEILIPIINDIFSDESLASTYSDKLNIYPSKAISEGKSWAITEKCSFLPALQHKATFTLADVQQDKYILKVVTKTSTPKEGAVMNMDIMQMNVMFTGTGKGTIIVDKETGWVLSKKHTENIQGTASTSFSEYFPMKLTFPCSMKSVTTIESHKL
jgi:hypothetical protein